MIRPYKESKDSGTLASNIGRDKRDTKVYEHRSNTDELSFFKSFFNFSEIYAVSFPVTNPIISSRRTALISS